MTSRAPMIACLAVVASTLVWPAQAAARDRTDVLLDKAAARREARQSIQAAEDAQKRRAIKEAQARKAEQPPNAERKDCPPDKQAKKPG